MLIKLFKIILILSLYQNPLYSKNKTLNDLNLQYLSNYFSGIVAYENNDNSEALTFFKSSRFLIKQHNSYLENYIYSLVLEGKVQQASNEIKQNLTKANSNFFEAHLILALDSLKKKNYKQSKDYLKQSYKFANNDRFALVIIETIKEYLYVFEENKLSLTKKNFGNLSFINQVFQRCYLDDEKTKLQFDQIINQSNGEDYSRYIFFYINYLVENERLDEAVKIADSLDYLNSSLLISQGKKWIKEKKLSEFKKIFSCKNSNDIVREFFFLVANIYSS